MRAQALDDRCGGLPGSQRNDDALAAPAANLGSTDDAVGGVIATLDDDIGAESGDEIERRVLVEDDDGVDGLEPGENIGALCFAPDRTVGALQAPNARVAVQADEECVPAQARAAEDVEMAGMEQIEDAIGEDDPATLPAAPVPRALPVEDLPRRIEGRQKLLSARGWKWMSRT